MWTHPDYSFWEHSSGATIMRCLNGTYAWLTPDGRDGQCRYLIDAQRMALK